MLKYYLRMKFNKNFIIKKADTKELKEECYKIRYQVFCEEKKFENEEEFVDKMEKNEVDNYSTHFIMYEKKTKRAIGTVRVVEPETQNEEKLYCPILKYCYDSLNQSFLSEYESELYEINEVSRLAVIKEFRVKKNDKNCLNKYVSLGLYLTAAAYLVKRNKKVSLFMMEPKLYRKLKMLGINCESVGDVIEYHGKRVPYKITNDSFKSGLPKLLSPLFNNLLKKV